MRFAMTTDQSELRDGVAEYLTGRCGPEVLRAGSGSPEAIRLARGLVELGATGLLVGEGRGGLGLDEDFLIPVMVEAGRSGAPLPLVETLAVAPSLVDDTRLEGIVSGDTWCSADARRCGLVRHATMSGLLARGGWAGKGSVEIVDLASASIEPVPDVDSTAGTARVSGGNVLAVIEEPDVVHRAWQRGVLGTAAALIGLARRLLDMTAAYVTERHQFGAPIGSFQAVKHRLATAAMALEFAGPAVAAAGHHLASNDGEAAHSVGTAKALASDAATGMVRATLQCHGAIAYTTEYDWQLYAKQVWALAEQWGSARWHRAAVAAQLGLARTPYSE